MGRLELAMIGRWQEKAHYTKPLLVLRGDGLVLLSLVAFRPSASPLEGHGYQENALA